MCIRCDSVFDNKLNSLFEYHDCEDEIMDSEKNQGEKSTVENPQDNPNSKRDSYLDDNFDNEDNSDDGSGIDPINFDIVKVKRNHERNLERIRL